MKTLFNASDRAALLPRLARLTAETPARWGKFDATRMVAHVNDAMRMGTGDLPVGPRKSSLRHAFGRWFAIYAPLPWPKGVPTAPELLQRGRADALQFTAECAAFSQLMNTVAARQGAANWPDHPAFGPMREKDWGALGYRHTDHHFRQFGI